MNNFAHLKEDSPFYPMFEGGKAPIQNILIPQRGMMEGSGEEDFYRLDVRRCSEEQIKGIAAFVAKQCNGTAEEVERSMRREGFIPLRQRHVSSTSSDSMAFL